MYGMGGSFWAVMCKKRLPVQRIPAAGETGELLDMIVTVGPFAFPTDFVVPEMEEHKSTTLILGRHFLATGRTLIDVQKGEVTLRVNEDEFKLNAVKAIQHPDTPKDCMKVDLIDSLVEEINMAESLESELENIFKDVPPDIEDSEELKEPLKFPQGEEKPHKLELKLVPPSLKYAFLGEGDTFQIGRAHV